MFPHRKKKKKKTKKKNNICMNVYKFFQQLLGTQSRKAQALYQKAKQD